jgi:hypothetical protein
MDVGLLSVYSQPTPLVLFKSLDFSYSKAIDVNLLVPGSPSFQNGTLYALGP